MKSRILVPALAVILATQSAAALEPTRLPHARPLALSALASPDLAPARALMHDVLAQDRSIRDETPSRGLWSIFSFGWFRTPTVHTAAPRCEVVVTPFHGRIETCTGALHTETRLGASGENRASRLMRTMQARIDNR